MTLDFRYYLAVFFRRLPYFILVFLGINALAVTAAFKLPPAYESTARLLMQSSQIPDSLAAPTVDTAALEQLQIIEQRLMTRENLLEIARKLKVFSDIALMTPDDIVTAMRDRTQIVKQAGRDQATLMSITFEAETARTAAAVVNEYVTRILSNNVSTRTRQAQDTLNFFRQEVDRLGTDLKAQSAKILEFQNKNADALPNTLTYRLTQQSNLQERLATMDRDISSLKDQKQRLIEIFRSTGQIQGVAPEAGLSPEAKKLESLRNELASARAVYSAENPKIKMLEARVAQLEERVKAQADTPAAGPDSAPPMSMLDIQLADLDSRIAQLEQQRSDTTGQLAKLKDSIDRTAANAVTLEALNRDYDNIQKQYNTATDRLAKASTGERIEALSKGQRIGVLEPASVPDQPTKPNRKKIVAFGVIAGLGLGLGLIVLIEMLNGAVQRPVDLISRLNITPIGTIPYIRTPGERVRRRLIITVLVLVVVGGIPAGVYLLDRYYLPLDLILARMNTKLGL